MYTYACAWLIHYEAEPDIAGVNIHWFARVCGTGWPAVQNIQTLRFSVGLYTYSKYVLYVYGREQYGIQKCRQGIVRVSPLFCQVLKTC